jgi:hypothetical protein
MLSINDNRRQQQVSGRCLVKCCSRDCLHYTFLKDNEKGQMFQAEVADCSNRARPAKLCHCSVHVKMC